MVDRSCTMPDGTNGIHLGYGYSNLEFTCKTYGISCPSGFTAGSLNTDDPAKAELTRCVKNIQMCNDNSDYDKQRNRCKDTNSGKITSVRSGAVCVANPQNEEIYVSGSFCQIAKKANPSCIERSNNDPQTTFNTRLQRCVLPCSDRYGTYGKGKYPPGSHLCR